MSVQLIASTELVMKFSLAGYGGLLARIINPDTGATFAIPLSPGDASSCDAPSPADPSEFEADSSPPPSLAPAVDASGDVPPHPAPSVPASARATHASTARDSRGLTD